MNENQYPSNCGSPNKNQSGNQVNNAYNTYNEKDAQNNAQNDIGFDANYGNPNSNGNMNKRYMCKNCGTMHYGNDAPKNCCKCDSCEFREM